MAMSAHIRIRVAVERKQPDLPRYVVVASSFVAPWNLQSTTTVDVSINGIPVSRRSICRWDDQRWFVSITQDDCRVLGIDTGSVITLSLCLASTHVPEELAELLRMDETARKAWEALTSSQQRMLREHIASARQSTTRLRRARKALVVA